MFDIAIIGGGPAGNAAAIFASLQGLKVILLESTKVPKYQPGESLLPGTEVLFQQLGIHPQISQGAFLRNPGHYTMNESKPIQFQPYSPNLQEVWLDYQIPRNILNTILQKRAEELGVYYWRGKHIKKLTMHKTRIRGILGKNFTINAHYFIDATGSTRLFSRFCKIPNLQLSKPLVAKYGYIQNNCPFQATLPIYIQNKESAIWYARISEHQFAWVLIHAKDQRITCTHDPLGGAMVSWQCAKQPVGSNYCLVGDAAGQLDPSSGKGALRALMSGIMAAHAITQILKGFIDEASAFNAYQQWFQGLFQQEITALRTMHFMQ